MIALIVDGTIDNSSGALNYSLTCQEQTLKDVDIPAENNKNTHIWIPQYLKMMLRLYESIIEDRKCHV